MRVIGTVSFEFLLRSSDRNGSQPTFDATDRRAIHGDTVFRKSSDDGVAEKSWACCESQTHPTFDAFDGSGGDLSKATIIVREQGTPKIPVLASRIGRQPCQSSVVYRYHVCADATGLHVLGGGHRLAQPLRSVVAIIEQLGKQFLPGGVGGRVGTGMPGDFQHRPRSPIYESSVHGSSGGSWDRDQHGWSRPRIGQCVCGTSVVEREVRAYLSARSSDHQVFAPGVGYLPEFLQSEASSPEFGVRDTVGRVPRKSDGKGADRSAINEGETGAAFWGSGSAPVHCDHLHEATAPKPKGGRLAVASLSN